MCEMGNTIIEQMGVLIAGLDTTKEKIAFHCLGPSGVLIERIDLTALKHMRGTSEDEILGAYSFPEAPIILSVGQTKGLQVSAIGFRELARINGKRDIFMSLNAVANGEPFKIDIHFRSVNGNYEMVRQQVTLKLMFIQDTKLEPYIETGDS
jgi:hypothetical protein